MSWTTPKTWQLNEILTSSDMNTYVRDNTLWLKNNWMADYVRLSHTLATNTAGGSTTPGSWQTRTINTEDSDTSGICTLASNEFTLAAGTYEMASICHFVNTGGYVRTRLYNVTDTTTMALSINTATGTPSIAVMSHIRTRFVLASSKTLRIEYYTQGLSAIGQGLLSNIGVSEIYAIVELWRVAL